jgi:hypothetical protein
VFVSGRLSLGVLGVLGVESKSVMSVCDRGGGWTEFDHPL